MNATKINAVDRLEFYAVQARQAGKTDQASIFEAAAKMVRSAMERANAVETMRDRMAMQAMQGFNANPAFSETGHGTIAEMAYKQADAMIDAREVTR